MCFIWGFDAIGGTVGTYGGRIFTAPLGVGISVPGCGSGVLRSLLLPRVGLVSGMAGRVVVFPLRRALILRQLIVVHCSLFLTPPFFWRNLFTKVVTEP